ncbi:mariner Mos1 transposase [Trichonephila clavipes]|nr:mariner Mos1 transposase [Trichonephila clavipes]
MKLIITRDESWIYGYDPETKQQSSQWKNPGSPRPKKARQGQTVNKEFYLDVMRRLRVAVRRKRPVLWASSHWMLHHDGAPAHTANLGSSS